MPRIFHKIFIVSVFCAALLPTLAHAGLTSGCLVAISRLRDSGSWLYHAGSEVGRRVSYDHGVVIEEQISWFGIRRRIIVTYPDGSKVDFNRTNRSLYTLKEYDHYPFRMLDPKEMAGLKILDFGCGDGDVVNTLRRFGVDAFGLDIYLTPKQRKKTYFTMADGQRTPYPDNQFDIVMSTWSAFTYLMYDAGNGKIGAHENAVAILQEMIRITKKGGVIRISPAPHIRTSEGVEFPAVEKILRENFPEVRIKSRPSPEWLQRFHAPPGSHKLGNLYEAPSEVWIELEKIP